MTASSRGEAEDGLPKWLKMAWYFLSPIGLPFALLIAYEKIGLRGAQGLFSLGYLHPDFFIFGSVCGIALIDWPVMGVVYMVQRCDSVTPVDKLMIAMAALASVALAIPG